MSKQIQLPSLINYNYITIKTTKSRIEKGLLAIPVSLTELFPKKKNKILIINNDNSEQQKSFTPYTSSSRECRIGGMRELYKKYKIQDGDELVILRLDDDKYKIIPEKIFQSEILKIETKLEEATENDIDTNIEQLSNLTNTTSDEVIKNEFVRLSKSKYKKRKKLQKKI